MLSEAAQVPYLRKSGIPPTPVAVIGRRFGRGPAEAAWLGRTCIVINKANFNAAFLHKTPTLLLVNLAHGTHFVSR